MVQTHTERGQGGAVDTQGGQQGAEDDNDGLCGATGKASRVVSYSGPPGGLSV